MTSKIWRRESNCCNFALKTNKKITTMNKKMFFSFALLLFVTSAYANKRDYVEQKIEMKGKNHFFEVNPPADMPDVYYNSELGVINIVDYVSATYYVTIYDDWWNVVITDTKVGGGTIDVSSLTSERWLFRQRTVKAAYTLSVS